jgi:hypothetical protein
MTGLEALERILLIVFIVAADGFALGIAPTLGFAALVSLLAFVLLEEHLGSRRYGGNGFH